MTPGDYTVSGTLMQGKRSAQCTANFTVKAYEPPTVSCSADPATVPPGGVATIAAVGMSPANRILTYSFSADSGQIMGTGPKVQLATAGSTASTINVTCNVVDDLGKTARATTSVAVLTQKAAVLPPPLAETQTLCSVGFERDKRRPVRVDNEAKACLDDVALDLQKQPDAKLVIVGNFSDGETAAQGAERSLNVRQYLVDEKGIDAGRIEVRYGAGTGREVDDILVPAGASYTNDKTTAFDPTSVKRIGQAYGKPGQHTGHGRHPRHHAVTHRAVARHRHRHHKAAAASAAPGPA
jgi:outer membrane protein OmpA-like peptidoglycan-associated protein